MNTNTEQIFLLNSSENQSVIATQKVTELNNTSQVNLENVEDFSNVCRTCATITEFVIPIFMGEGLQNNLADKIHEHLPIKVSEQDLLPQVVCYQCASTLLAWHELVKCCVQADTALKTRLSVIHAKQKSASYDAGECSDKEPKAKSRNSIQVTDIRDILMRHFQLSDQDLDNSGLEFVCEKCENQSNLPTLQSFLEHLKSQHNIKLNTKMSVECFIKEYVSVVETLVTEDETIGEELEKEMTDVNIPRFCCPYCASAFSSAARLTCHLNKHVNVNIDDGLACCDNVYNDWKFFVTHLQEQHLSCSNSETNICQSCGFVADDVDALQAHIAIKHEVINSDTHHRKERTSNSDKCQKYIPAVCPECNKTFSNKYNMFVHMKSHKSTEMFPCKRCKKRYRSQASLKSHHKLAHEGILTFLCSFCGEAFPTRIARDVHSRIHTGHRPYTCNFCQKSYRAKNTLDRHLEMHLDIRKYECYICLKKFRKKTHLSYHLGTHKKKNKK